MYKNSGKQLNTMDKPLKGTSDDDKIDLEEESKIKGISGVHNIIETSNLFDVKKFTNILLVSTVTILRWIVSV